MLPNFALIDFFKRLPYLPLVEVSKHLLDRDLVLLSVISPEWEASIINRPQRFGYVKHLIATKEKYEIKIQLDDCTPDPVPNFLGYQYYETTEMNIQFINSDTDKEVITEETENQSDRCTEFTRSIIVYSKNWQIDGNQRILNIAHILKNKFQIQFCNVIFENATWITQNDLLLLNCRSTKIGDNHLTDKDLNAFLHSWMTGNNDKMQHYSFKVGDDVRIEEVTRGLITEKWDPERRDRKFIPRRIEDKVALRPIDMAVGLDITRPKTTSDNNIATIHITDNILYFIVWDKHDTFEEQLKMVKWFLTFYNRELSRGNPGSPGYTYFTDMRKKMLESLRNITEDPEADFLENEFPDTRSDTDGDHYSDDEPDEVYSDSDD